MTFEVDSFGDAIAYDTLKKVGCVVKGGASNLSEARERYIEYMATVAAPPQGAEKDIAEVRKYVEKYVLVGYITKVVL